MNKAHPYFVNDPFSDWDRQNGVWANCPLPQKVMGSFENQWAVLIFGWAVFKLPKKSFTETFVENTYVY